jgi:hypothetical protein
MNRLKEIPEVPFPDPLSFEAECTYEGHNDDVREFHACQVCHGMTINRAFCMDGIIPHTFEVEDQGEQVELKCVFCGKISKE